MSALRKTLFPLAWLAVFLAAAHDAHYAWAHRADLQSWEANPVACWAVTKVGLETVVWFKFIGLAFAAGLALYCRLYQKPLERALTLAAAGAYAALSLYYLFGVQQPNHPVVMSCLSF